MVVGTEVEFVKDGSTIRGVVIQAPNGRVTAIGKDGVEKVLVKHSEGTRGVPVDAITIIGEDFEETKPISDPVAEAPQEAETSLRGLNFSVITFENNPTFDQETGKVTRETGTAKVVSMAERQIVLVNIGGVNIPFYLSTGKAGKKNVAAGKWYPILGIDVDGWLNKGSEAEINNYYGSAKLKAAALELDRTLGTTSQSTKVSSKAILGSVNAGLASMGITPTANNETLTAKRLKDNQQKLLDFLGESDNVSDKKSEESTEIVDSKEESSDKTPDKKEDNLSQKLQEIEDEYQSALRHADSWAKTDPETAGKKRKVAGMIKAAAIREATGDLTAKEQQKKDAYEASNYTGKPVSVDGRNGKVTGVSFGRVSVKFEDGTSKSFPPDQINPPSSVEAETEAPPVAEAPESQQVTPDTLPSVTDEPTSKESSTDENKVLVRPAVESKADSAAQALIEQNKTFLTQANYDALALKRLKMLLKGVQVSTSSEVTETGETATYTVEASAEVKKMKSAKSGYEAVLNCLGGAK